MAGDERPSERERREAELAAALRANLRRRKSAPASPAPPAPPLPKPGDDR